MRDKSLNFIVDLVIYPFDIMVSINQTDEAFRKSIMKYLPPDCLKDLETDKEILNLGKTCNGRTINFSTGHQTVIRIKNYPRQPRDVGVLGHEIFHACSFVLWRMGIPLEIEKTDEVYAYLIGYVTSKIFNRLY